MNLNSFYSEYAGVLGEYQKKKEPQSGFGCGLDRKKMKTEEAIEEKKEERASEKYLIKRKVLFGFVLLISIVLLLGAGGLAFKAGFSFDGMYCWEKKEIEKTLQKNQEIARLLQNDLYLERLSYFWREDGTFGKPVFQDFRNTLLISDLSGGTELALPFLKLGGSSDILDYSLEELLEYEVVYFVKPLVNTVERKEKLEENVRQLLKLGKKILIEPEPSKDFDIFGIHAVEEVRESEISLYFTKEAPERFRVFDRTDHSYAGVFVSLYGLDQEYAYFLQNEGDLKNSVFGRKNLEEGSVYFLGGAFRDYLTAVYMQHHSFRKIPKEVFTLDARSKLFYEVVLEELGAEKSGEVKYIGDARPEQNFYFYKIAGGSMLAVAVLLCFWILRYPKRYFSLLKRLIGKMRSFLDLEF